jgi:hypothetical protein
LFEYLRTGPNSLLYTLPDQRMDPIEVDLGRLSSVSTCWDKSYSKLCKNEQWLYLEQSSALGLFLFAHPSTDWLWPLPSSNVALSTVSVAPPCLIRSLSAWLLLLLVYLGPRSQQDAAVLERVVALALFEPVSVRILTGPPCS